MVYSIRYTPPEPLAEITYRGHLRGGDVAESLESLAEQLPKSLPWLSVLCDARQATSIMAAPEDVRRTVRALRRIEACAPRGRGAYVGGDNHALFVSLVRAVLTMVSKSSRERAVFADYAEGLEWLNEPTHGAATERA